MSTILVDRLGLREGRGEIDVLEADPHDPDTVVAGDLELGAVILHEPESRYPYGSEALNLQCPVSFDRELHLILAILQIRANLRPFPRLLFTTTIRT